LHAGWVLREEDVMNGTTDVFGNGMKYLFDMAAIELRNMEALGQAQQKLVEGWSLLAQRQAEIAQGTLRRSFDQQAPKPPTVGFGPTNLIDQIDGLKTAILENQANANILSELAARSSGEAMSILQARLLAALDEFKAALGQVALPSPTK
jgi:hypothetical protein